MMPIEAALQRQHVMTFVDLLFPGMAVGAAILYIRSPHSSMTARDCGLDCTHATYRLSGPSLYQDLRVGPFVQVG